MAARQRHQRALFQAAEAPVFQYGVQAFAALLRGESGAPETGGDQLLQADGELPIEVLLLGQERHTALEWNLQSNLSGQRFLQAGDDLQQAAFPGAVRTDDGGQADRAGIDFFGFRVLDVATLNQLEKDLNAYGVKTERIPAGELLETGERVRFQAPTGHFFELYAEKTHVGNGSGLVNRGQCFNCLAG